MTKERSEYERGFIDGMQKQMQSSVDKAVNAVSKRKWVGEPVAWGMETDGLIYDVICPAEHAREEGEYTIPLYTHPKEWVRLTDEEIELIYMDITTKKIARALEAKLKEKNT